MEPWRPVDVRELPRRRRRWHPAIVVPLVLVAGFGAVSIVGLWRYANADHLGILDDPDVVNRASLACATMAQQIAAIPQQQPGDVTGEVGAIRTQDQALSSLVASMQALGQDRLNHDHPHSCGSPTGKRSSACARPTRTISQRATTPPW